MKNEENLYLKSIYRYKFHSLLSKIFISYISILLVVVIINVSVYYYVQNIIIDKEINSSEDYLSYISLIIDGELSHVKEMMYSFLQSPDITKKLNIINDDIYSQAGIISALTNLKNNSAIVSQCFLYNKKLDYVIGNSGTLSKEVLFNNFSKYYNLKSIEVADMLDTFKDFKIIPGHKESSDNAGSQSGMQSTIKAGNVTSMITGVSYSSNINRLVVTINEQDIYNVIMKTNIVKYGSAQIVDNSGYVISSSDSDKAGTKFDESLLAEISTNNSLHKLNFNNNLVVYQKSKFIDGYYITVIPYKNILHNFNTIRYIFVYALIILIILGILFALFYSRAFYSPVLALMGKLAAPKAGDVKYKDEFAFMTNLVENIQSSYNKYEEGTALGRMMETGNYSEEVVRLFSNENFLVVIIRGPSTTKLMVHIKEYINSHELMNFILKVTKGNEEDCFLIINGNNIDIQSVNQYLSELKENLESTYNYFMIIGIGNICYELADVSTSLKNAFTAIRQGICPDEKCIFQFKMDTRETYKIYFPIDFDDSMMNILICGSEEKVAGYISNIFDQNKMLPHLYMKIIYTEFINTYIKIASKFSHEYYINDITMNVENEYRPSHVQKFINGLYCEIIPLIEVPQNTARRVELYISEFIEKNYHDENITIEKIADELKLSASYVSTLFKKSRGIAFSLYVLEYRINKAKELLENTDYSIKEISHKVGCGTYNSFIRSFGKIIGISPGEYRAINKNKE